MKHPDAKTEIRVPEEYKPLLEDLRLIQKCPDNPNRMGKRAREGLWKSLQKYGWVYPILVDKKGILGDGEQRLETCLANNEYYGPVLRLDVEDVDRRLLRQITNKLRGVHDPDKDLLEYRRLIEGGRRKELISILAINEKAIKDALKGKIKEDSYRIPPLDEVVTDIELGDKYRLGNHFLICGDATKAEYMDLLISKVKIDCVFTDPPYGVYVGDWSNSLRDRKGTEGRGIYKDIEPEKFEEFSTNWLKNIRNHLAEYNSLYIWINGVNIRNLLNALNTLNYKMPNNIQWVKNTFVFSRIDYKPQHQTAIYGWYGKHKFYGPFNETTVWKHPKPSKNKEHPTMMPIDICARGITNSTMPEMNVLDPFGGSGSTLIACEQTDRPCYMMEIVPEYCQLIIDRWEAYTGEVAEKI